MVACRHRFVKAKASDMLDAHYLYYLPFCHHFASNDALHSLVAPQLLSSDQKFIPGSELKATLKAAVLARRVQRTDEVPDAV
jgi:hypothetical protein